jgi:hypothetical protein
MLMMQAGNFAVSIDVHALASILRLSVCPGHTSLKGSRAVIMRIANNLEHDVVSWQILMTCCENSNAVSVGIAETLSKCPCECDTCALKVLLDSYIEAGKFLHVCPVLMQQSSGYMCSLMRGPCLCTSRSCPALQSCRCGQCEIFDVIWRHGLLRLHYLQARVAIDIMRFRHNHHLFYQYYATPLSRRHISQRFCFIMRSR